MALLESRGMARQRNFLLAILRAMVGDRKTETGRGAELLLVAEPHRLLASSGLWVAAARFRFHFRLCLHLDTLHSQPHYQLSYQAKRTTLLKLLGCLCSAFALLCAMRLKIETPLERRLTTGGGRIRRRGGRGRPKIRPQGIVVFFEDRLEIAILLGKELQARRKLLDQGLAGVLIVSPHSLDVRPLLFHLGPHHPVLLEHEQRTSQPHHDDRAQSHHKQELELLVTQLQLLQRGA